MGGVPTNNPQTPRPAAQTATQAQPQAQPQAAARSDRPPALYRDFTNDSFAKSDRAKNSQKDIQQFYGGQYTRDWENMRSAEASGDSNRINEAQTRLAADIAALHNLEKQFYVENGDTASQAGKYSQANFTQEGTTEQLLRMAGATHVNSSDYVFTGVSANQEGAAGQQVTAQMRDNRFQATVAAVTSSTSGQVQTTSSYGQAGSDWTNAANTGNLQSGQSNTASTYYTRDANGNVVAKP